MSSLAVYQYQRTTYQLSPPTPTCLKILSLAYSGVALPFWAFSALAVFDSHFADLFLALGSSLSCLAVLLLSVRTGSLRCGATTRAVLVLHGQLRQCCGCRVRR